MDLRKSNLKSMKMTTEVPKHVSKTSQLSGKAKDSLTGKNVTSEHVTTKTPSGPYGDKHS